MIAGITLDISNLERMDDQPEFPEGTNLTLSTGEFCVGMPEDTLFLMIEKFPVEYNDFSIYTIVPGFPPIVMETLPITKILGMEEIFYEHELFD